MRLDYPLYLLAIVFFALSAISYVLLAGSDVQLLFVVATVVLGFLSIGAGVAQKQDALKTEVSQVPPPPPAPDQVIVQPQATPPPPTAPTKVEIPKTEIATVEPTPIVVAEKPETALVESKSAPQVLVPVTETQATSAAESTQQIAAVASSVPVKNALTQIRGINASRTEQLKANGVNSISDLANASADELAAKIGVSPKIVKMWIGSAKKIAK
jgi:predicted flap endonuclease-1-like 5' DNA nuclease